MARAEHGSEKEMDTLEAIISDFNERWLSGIADNSDEGKVKIVNLFKKATAHKDYESKVNSYQDKQNKDLAFRRIIDEIMREQRRQEMELYKRYANDESFNQALFDTFKRMAVNEQMDLL